MIADLSTRRELLAGVSLASAIGNLDANGISPAQQGWRITDPNGNPIADSLGLIGVANVLGSAVSFTGSVTGTIVAQTIVTVTFTLTRATTVKMLACGTGVVSGAAGQFAYGTIFIDGVDFGHANNGAKMLWDKSNPGYTSTTIELIRTLAGASGGTSHTIDVRAGIDNVALTWTNYQITLDCFGMGA